ncbi:LysR family transcriptional regulator [Yoonia maritima]|uniref:LysR family transcriptional regulator n=1 Tax=Yoonia maritima TaxID=1435347 RepID=UPI0019550751
MSENFNALATFATVARERSFTRAAAKLGISQSALSQQVQNLEARLGVRLLTRTTRSVAPTEAGERLLTTISPKFEEIEHAIADLRAMRDRPAGTIRLTAGEHPAVSILQPALAEFLPGFPEIKVELIVDYGLADIVAQGFDAGVRLGEQLEKDMVAIRIGPEMRMAVVAAPSYFARRPAPHTAEDLMAHNCISSRLPTYGSIFQWGLEKNGHQVKVRSEGQMVLNTLGLRISAALDGLGIAYLPEDQVLGHIAAGRLVRVLEDWCPSFPGYHLYYPSRKHPSAAFSLLLDRLRYRE